MMVNSIQSTGSVFNVNAQKVKKQEKAEVNNQQTEQKPVVAADGNATKAYILGGTRAAAKKPQDPIKAWVNSLPFADDLSPEDKRNLGNVIRKNDQETDYMKKMIHLVCKKMVTPFATTSLCKHGQMSELAKSDIDTYYDKVKEQGMSIKDAFVPEAASQKEGQETAKVGDVFRVAGQDNIYVKNGDNESKQLKMDADTYLKLFPPVERYAACQGGNGDCYFLSSVNAIMENPYSRTAVYDCFTQNGNDVEVKFPNGKVSENCPNAKLPKGADISKYTDGPMGMKLLEYTYGKDVEAQRFEQYDEIVSKEFKKMDKDLKKWEKKTPQDDLALKKQKEIKKRIENWKTGQAQFEEMRNNPNNTKVLIEDDNCDLVIGKFGPMFEEVSKVDSDYKNPHEFYLGGLGGYADPVMETFGFVSETVETDVDEDYIIECKKCSRYFEDHGTYSDHIDRCVRITTMIRDMKNYFDLTYQH